MIVVLVVVVSDSCGDGVGSGGGGVSSDIGGGHSDSGVGDSWLKCLG